MRNKSLTAFFCILFASFSIILPKLNLAYEQEINSLSSAITEKASASGKKTIAVVDFTDLQGDVTELGRFLAEELSVSLSGASKGFDVVDRTHLKSLLAEHKLSSTGLIDPKTARELGKIVGVDALVTGTITPFGDSIRLSIKVLDIETAKVIIASTANVAKTKAIEELLTRGIEPVQSTTRQAFTTGYVSSTGGLKSKKVGDLMVTLKSVVVSSKERVGVIMDFFNRSDKELKLAASTGAPRLTDERGNVFRFEGYNGGSQYHRGTFKWKNDGVGLNAKSSSTVILYFQPRKIDEKRIETISEIGANFGVSFDYVLFDFKDESESHHSVSFTDVKAQRD